ncbi:MAG TPA: hypothetical protein VGE96_00105, partial [Steroidobacteraceae bacterium]
MANRIIVLLIAAITGGCAVAPMPRIPPQTSEVNAEDVMRQMMEARGRGEAPPEAVDDNGVQVVFQSGHTSSLTAVGVSADGRYLISAGQDEQTRVWDVASGQELRAVTGSGLVAWPQRVGFTADGARFFTEGWGTATFYDRQQGTKIERPSALSWASCPVGTCIAAQGRIRLDTRREGS